MLQSRKRARVAGDPSTKSRRQAQAISASINAKFPVKDYGRSYTKRGVPGSEPMNVFGPSFKDATPAQRANRKTYGYSGRGGFFGDAWNWTKGAVGNVARNWDNLPRYLEGQVMDHVVKPMLGQGMYMGGKGLYSNAGAISNDIIKTPTGNHFEIPQFTQKSDAGIIISHKEYISDVYAGSDQKFSNTQFSLNPGLERTFPWLSQVAANYEEYDLVQCIYTFRSTSTEFGLSTGALPTIIMATNYNVSNAPFNNKQEMLEYDAAMSGKSSENQMHGIECDPSKLSGTNGKYVRSAPVLPGEDLKSYDHGLFQIAVVNTPKELFNQALGELWVSYTVRLNKPKLFTNLGYAISRDMFLQTFILGTTTYAPTDGIFMQNIDFQTPSTTLLYGQQNNIGVQLSLPVQTLLPPLVLPAVSPYPSYYEKYKDTPTTRGFCLMTFPSSCNGNFRILFRGTSRGTLSRCPITVITPVYNGNIVIQNDIYGGTNDNTGATDAPRSISINPYVSPLASNNSTGQNSDSWSYEIHVKVNTADQGIENQIFFALHSTAGATDAHANIAWVNCFCSIEEMNFKNGSSQLSGGTNIEARPVWVDQNNLIVVPV